LGASEPNRLAEHCLVAENEDVSQAKMVAKRQGSGARAFGPHKMRKLNFAVSNHPYRTYKLLVFHTPRQDI
jgi:hypothetical protein